MEFKINKIDTDIRVRFEEDRRHQKIHSGDDSAAIKNLKDDEGKNKNDKKHSKKRNKKFITVDGEKKDIYGLEIEVEKIEFISECNIKGRILDTTK